MSRRGWRDSAGPSRAPREKSRRLRGAQPKVELVQRDWTVLAAMLVSDAEEVRNPSLTPACSLLH